MVKQGCIWLFGEPGRSGGTAGTGQLQALTGKWGSFAPLWRWSKPTLMPPIRVLLRHVADFQIIAFRVHVLWPLRTRQVRIQILYKTAHSRAAFNWEGSRLTTRSTISAALRSTSPSS